MAEWLPNPGHLPPQCVDLDEFGNETGKAFRVHVRLFGGYTTAGAQPNGWAANGRGACSWKITRPPHDYDIKEFMVI